MNAEKAVRAGVSSYTLAGWLSILQAVIAILPQVVVDFFAGSMSLSGYGILQVITGISAIGKLLGIYVLLMFRRLLNERQSFHSVDSLITALICCYAAAALVVAVELVSGSRLSIIFALPIVYALSSLISIFYAIRLHKLEFSLSGLLKPYVYSTIAGGLLGVTLVLGEYGRPFYMVSVILLGIILIRAESEPQYL